MARCKCGDCGWGDEERYERHPINVKLVKELEKKMRPAALRYSEKLQRIVGADRTTTLDGYSPKSVLTQGWINQEKREKKSLKRAGLGTGLSWEKISWGWRVPKHLKPQIDELIALEKKQEKRDKRKKKEEREKRKKRLQRQNKKQGKCQKRRKK